MSTVIPIDHGNSGIKTEHFEFTSGLSEHLVRPPLADDLIEYKGRYWTLSSNRISYKRDKTKDERFFILTLFAVAKELVRSGYQPMFEPVTLAIGLPPEHYGAGKENFANYFKRRDTIKYVYNEYPINLIINDVFVYPQAFSAVVPQADRFRSIPRVFIIDIGGMTTDILLLKNGKPDLQFCRSLESGTITLQNDLIGKVNSLHDMIIEEDHITAVLQGKETILPEEVCETIRFGCQRHAENILDKLRELKVDLRSNPAIFIGGGSILLKPFIEKSELVTKAEFVKNVNANAIGYMLLAKHQLPQN